nr:hypothetical protein [Tanacetum cinerariifolium]
MSNDKESSAAGTDNRAPMLEENDYESWKIRMKSTKGNQGYGKKTDRIGKKVICYNYRGEGHVARECKEPKRAKDTQYYKDKMMLSDAKDRGVILDAEAEAFLADVECTESYDESLASQLQ